MLDNKPINKIVWVDLETVPQYRSFFDMSENMQELFLKRFKKKSEIMLGEVMDNWDLTKMRADRDNKELVKDIEALYQNNAALHAEFLKIVCISVGVFKDIPEQIKPEDKLKFQMKSFYGTDEVKLLTEFCTAFEKVLNKKFNHEWHMSAFNGLVFDFPVLAKRMLLNWMPLPPYFDVAEMKPWEMKHLEDLKGVWKWGVWDGNASLPLLCEAFGLTSSKVDIDGSQVRDVYYEKGDVERIARYCELDIKKTAELHLRMKGMRNEVIDY